MVGGITQQGRDVVTNVLDVNEPTDEELIALAAREGSDGPAFVALLDRHRQRVWQICFRLMGNEHDANDAAQEVFVRLFVNRAKFAGRSKFTTWLHGMALRTCLTLRRGRGRRLRRESQLRTAASAQHLADGSASQEGLSLDLDQMLETLDEEDRAMLILKYAESYTFEELAALFELSVSACKMRVSRARERLQKQYDEGRRLDHRDGPQRTV